MVPVHLLAVSDHIVVSIDAHSHKDCFQLMYCKGGRGEILLDGRRIEAQRGHMYLARPTVQHGMVQKGGLRLAEIKFLIKDEVLLDAVTAIPEDVDVDKDPPLAASFREVLREGLSDAPYGYEATSTALLLFLYRLLRSLNIVMPHHSDKYTAFSDYRKEIDLLAVADYVERHLHEEITLERLADTVHFSTSYLSAKFKEKWGVPLMKYVNLLRIEKAKELLITTEEPISEIALSVGFQSLHYFSRFFKQKNGMSPNAYRAENKK
ncbi:MAG: helix-turn-helix transcriptional regulator [Clostridia bacterium]|nr:helix-turn-helix transcriptional regulator [Clostridia bacterium]